MDAKTFKKLNEKLGDYGCYGYMDVSTGHITESDKDLLEAGNDPTGTVLIATYPEGFFLSIGEEEEIDDSFSKELHDLISYARQNGCALLRLDADGMSFPDFPTFDW
jgi:hypothetical protein